MRQLVAVLALISVWLISHMAVADWGPLTFDDPIFDDPNECGTCEEEITGGYNVFNDLSVTQDNGGTPHFTLYGYYSDATFNRLRVKNTASDPFRMNDDFAMLEVVDSYINAYSYQCSDPNDDAHTDGVQGLANYNNITSRRTTWDFRTPEDPNDPNLPTLPEGCNWSNGTALRVMEDYAHPLGILLEDTVIIDGAIALLPWFTAVDAYVQMSNVCIVITQWGEWNWLSMNTGSGHWNFTGYDNVHRCHFNMVGELVEDEEITCDDPENSWVNVVSPGTLTCP